MLSFLFLHTHWEPGKPTQQVCSFVLKLKKKLHDFRSYQSWEREREGGEREGEKFTWICKASTPHGNHPSKMHRRKNQRGYLAVKMSLQCGESTTTLNFLFPSYPFYLFANLAWKYELLPQCLNIQQQLLDNLLLQKNLVTAQCNLGWRGFNTTNKGLRYFSWK